MGTQFWYFYDIAAVAILIITMYNGYRKGFVRTIMTIAGYVAAVVIAWTCSIFIADKVYDNFLKEKNDKIISDAVNSIDYSAKFKDALKEYGVTLKDDEIEMLLERDDPSDFYEYVKANQGYTGSKKEFDSVLADSASRTLQGMFDSAQIPFSDSTSSEVLKADNNSELKNMIGDIIDGSVGTNTKELANGYLRSVEIMILRVIFSTIISSVLMIIASRLMTLVTIRPNKLTMATLNSRLGALIGIVKAAFYLYIFANMVHIVVAIGKENMIFFNNDVISKTKVFKYIYEAVLSIV